MFEAQLTQLPGVVVGRVTGVDETGLPIVSTGAGEVPAVHVLWTADAPAWADCIGLRVAIALDGGDESRPLVLGLLDIETMTYESLPIEALGNAKYVARGALERVKSAQTAVGGAIAWHLDYRVNGQCVRRASGRRIQLRESPDQ